MIDALAGRVLAGDLRAAARLMRLVDDGSAEAARAIAAIYKQSRPASSIGITGSPGAGKSSLIDRMIRLFRARGERVGVIAIDPSSPSSGGAILGDRLRMQDHALDPGVFVRSLATRGALGGLSRSTTATMAVLEGLGFERVIIETVGVGQDEVDVARVVETTVVVLAPGLGDDVQALKAGLMEIADVFCVNKADREGADRTAAEVEQALRLGPEPPGGYPPVLKTSAASGDGVAELIAAIDRARAAIEGTPVLPARRRSRARLELETAIQDRLLAEALARAGGDAAIEAAASRVAARSSAASDESDALFKA
jgi:LAO/AO transport system kinase